MLINPPAHSGEQLLVAVAVPRAGVGVVGPVVLAEPVYDLVDVGGGHQEVEGSVSVVMVQGQAVVGEHQASPSMRCPSSSEG